MNRISQQGYIGGTTHTEDHAVKVKPRPIVSNDLKVQRKFIMMLRQIERLHCDSYTVIEGAEIWRSIGGGFRVTMNGETFKRNGKTANAFESVATWIWQKMTAKQEAA